MKNKILQAQENTLRTLDKAKPTILVAAGGTAGHVNPALSIARKIMKYRPDWQIVFCGNGNRMEYDLISQTEFPFYWVEAAKFSKNIIELAKNMTTNYRGYRQARKLIDELNVVGAIGAGGYVTFPVITAAKNRKIPSFLHEQNAHSGLSNRSLSKDADIVFISYEATREDFPKAHEVVFSGNPVSDEFYEITYESARASLNLTDDEFYILVTGGSLGAATLNKLTLGLAQDFSSREDLGNYNIHLVAGKNNYEEISSELAAVENVKVSDYIYNMPEEMAASDLVICRAGAGTCAELQVLEKPSILLPYPYATADHQTKNAQALVDVGAAYMFQDDELELNEIIDLIKGLMADRNKLDTMQENLSKLATKNSAELIADAILEKLGVEN